MPFNILNNSKLFCLLARFVFGCRCNLFTFTLIKFHLQTPTWTWPKCYVVIFSRAKRVSSAFNLILMFWSKSLFFLSLSQHQKAQRKLANHIMSYQLQLHVISKVAYSGKDKLCLWTLFVCLFSTDLLGKLPKNWGERFHLMF